MKRYLHLVHLHYIHIADLKDTIKIKINSMIRGHTQTTYLDRHAWVKGLPNVYGTT